MKKQTTPDFFDRLKCGEPSAYRQLIEEHGRHVEDFLIAVLRSREDAEEIAQDIFIHIWNKRETLVFDKMQGVKSYIFTLARTRAIDRINQRKRDRILYTDQMLTPADHAGSPEEAVVAAQLRISIDTATGRMPRMRQTIYRMRYDQGKSNEQIAKELNLKSSTVRAHISIALKEIRDIIRMITLMI